MNSNSKVNIDKWISKENFDKFYRIVNEKKIVIYGMGNTTDLYQEGLKRIENVLPIWGYCDSNEVMRKKKLQQQKGAVTGRIKQNRRYMCSYMCRKCRCIYINY